MNLNKRTFLTVALCLHPFVTSAWSAMITISSQNVNMNQPALQRIETEAFTLEFTNPMDESLLSIQPEHIAQDNWLLDEAFSMHNSWISLAGQDYSSLFDWNNDNDLSLFFEFGTLDRFDMLRLPLAEESGSLLEYHSITMPIIASIL